MTTAEKAESIIAGLSNRVKGSAIERDGSDRFELLRFLPGWQKGTRCLVNYFSNQAGSIFFKFKYLIGDVTSLGALQELVQMNFNAPFWPDRMWHASVRTAGQDTYLVMVTTFSISPSTPVDEAADMIIGALSSAALSPPNIPAGVSCWLDLPDIR